MAKSSEFERSSLQHADIKLGFDNYDVLQQLGAFVREMRTGTGPSQAALRDASGVGQEEISRLELG
jgi:hypothetical protein